MARGDREKRLPDLELERRPDQREAHRRPVLLPESRIDHGLEVFGVLHEGGLWPAGLEVGHSGLRPGFLGKAEAADTALRRHHECQAEGAVEPAPADGQAAPAAGIGAGAHRLPCQEQVVQPSRTRQTHGIGGGERGEALAQKRAGVVEREILLVALGTYADPLGEHALEMRAANASSESGPSAASIWSMARRMTW